VPNDENMDDICNECLVKDMCLPEIKGWIEYKYAHFAACFNKELSPEGFNENRF
jgi:hypothetical protein